MNNLLFEIRNNVGLVTVNRPKSLNALNPETVEELAALFGELADKDELIGVILTGSGEKAFVAGADISVMQGYDTLAGREFGRLGHRAMDAVASLPQPVIAAINGFALGGGCELALACDFRICSENARFGQPEVNLGVIPGFGGTQRLPRLVGTGLAMELLLTGDMIDAQEAFRIGLVNRVVAQDELLAHCFGIMEKIGQKGPLAVKLCKEAVRSGMEMDLARACSSEADLFALCFASEDQNEGMNAFLEKRQARFKGC